MFYLLAAIQTLIEPSQPTQPMPAPVSRESKRMKVSDREDDDVLVEWMNRSKYKDMLISHYLVDVDVNNNVFSSYSCCSRFNMHLFQAGFKSPHAYVRTYEPYKGCSKEEKISYVYCGFCGPTPYPPAGDPTPTTYNSLKYIKMSQFGNFHNMVNHSLTSAKHTTNRRLRMSEYSVTPARAAVPDHNLGTSWALFAEPEWIYTTKVLRTLGVSESLTGPSSTGSTRTTSLAPTPLTTTTTTALAPPLPPPSFQTTSGLANTQDLSVTFLCHKACRPQDGAHPCFLQEDGSFLLQKCLFCSGTHLAHECCSPSTSAPSNAHKCAFVIKKNVEGGLGFKCCRHPQYNLEIIQQ